MGHLTDDGFVESVCALFLMVMWIFYNYLTRNYNYWAARGVPFKTPEFPYGSLKDALLTKESVCQAHDKVYKQFINERFYGIIDIQEPQLVIKDPELIKQIMVKDFHHFVDRPTILLNPCEYITRNLLTLEGEEWRNMRSKLTTTFTSRKLKLMFALMERCSEELKAQLEKELTDSDVIDAKNIFSRFTLEIIASCAFGIETNSVTEKKSKFFQMLESTKSTKLTYSKRVFRSLFPKTSQLLNINLYTRELRDFVTNIVRDNIEYRKKHNVTRNDFLGLLININQDLDVRTNQDEENRTRTEGLTLEQMTAQAFAFFLAGFESASSLMAFCLYELSCNQNVQEKLYQELKEAMNKNEDKISYEMLTNTDFLDQVMNETLRMYGSAQVLNRRCTKRYQLPDSDLILEEGTKVLVPLFSIHHDPRYFPDPYAFKPERFAPDEARLRHPSVFIPFGEGPRNCIGMRFGMMQARVGLATVILNYQVDLSLEQEVPIEIDKTAFALKSAKPVFLKFIRRSSE